MTVPLLLSTIHQCISHFSLDIIMYTEIAKFFNLTLDSPYDPNPINTIQEKFKNKLFDIFHTEGANYTDYLMLPRFASLKHSTQQMLRLLFNTIWAQYQRKTSREKHQPFIKELEKLVPQFKALNDIETFHLQLFNTFIISKLCKKNICHQQKKDASSLSSSYISPQSQFKRPREPSFFIMDSQQKQNINFSPPTINNINSLNKTVFPKIQDNPQQSNPVCTDQKFVKNLSSFPIIKSHIQNNSIYSPNEINKLSGQKHFSSQQNMQIQNHTQSSKSSQISVHQSGQKKSHTASNDEELFQKIESYMFVQCACQGTLKNHSDQYMVCKQCQFYYHYECLLMDQNTVSEICPCCKLKQGSNMFIKIYPQAYGKRWCKNMNSQKLSLFLTQKQIEKMKEQRMKCKLTSQLEYQLRFFKITRRGRNNKVNPLQQQSSNRKFNNLPLPTNYIEKIQAYNQFQISLRPTEQDKNEECSYFFAIFMVQKFSQLQLTQQLFSNITDQNSVDESYLKRFLIPQQQFLQIKMKDPNSQRRITYPVRGNNCQHPEVFDYLSMLEYYKEYGQKLNQKHCPVCEQQIDHMIVDKFLLEKIKQLAETSQKDCEIMKYYIDGRVEFTEEDESEGSDSNENEQDNVEQEQDDDLSS